MITFKDILSNKEVIEEYTKIDKQNKYPFNHGLQHIKNVCDLMSKLCDALKIKDEEKECLLIACALHDIGQVDGRDNHGLKAKDYIVKNYEEQLKDYEYYNDILNAVEHHDQKVNLQESPLFTNLVCFADKMDFSFKRLEENYKEQFGYIAYEDVVEVDFECDNKTFALKIKTTEKINKEDLLMEHKFFYKVITATITISKKIGVDYCIKVNDEIVSLMDIIRSNVNRLKNKMSLNIDSIFIEENNMVDTYFYGDENLHPLYSVSKLLTAMAVGIAIEKQMKVNGKNFDLETNVYDALKGKVNITNIKNIEKIRRWTLKDLLLHSTGYDKQMLSERYISDIDKNDLLNYALNYDIPHEVGNRYAYNNVEPFIISVLFSECFGANLSDFINENIFKKLDIKEYDWNNYGKYCPGATGLYLKHSDFHKLGQLLLNEGKYKGDQVIPSKWIKEMVGPQMNTPNEYKESRVFPKISVGYYTFISRDGYVFRDGKNGQYIIMNKDKNLLITILSSEENMKNITEIFRDVL